MSESVRDWNSQPPYDYADYRSTALRAPTRKLVALRHGLSERTGPVFGDESVVPGDSDLTHNGRVNGEPVGERIIVTGRVVDEDGRPVRSALVEVWQANAAGRYVHSDDRHDAPLDPNFLGAGRAVTDQDGRYRFVTIRPGAYPWGNHRNAWRPPHIHFSLLGPTIASRLVTQIYFPGDPLLAFDPIYLGAPAGARERMVAAFSPDVTSEGFALGYEWDIVLRGRGETPVEGQGR